MSPSTPLEWARWSREVSMSMRLPAGEAHVLQVLAGHANARGTCYPSVELIAEEVRKSIGHAYRLLRALARRGLVRSRQRGPTTALRELVADAAEWVGSQLSFFDAPASSRPARSRRSQSPAAAAPAAGPDRLPLPVADGAASAPVSACPRMGATKPSHGCDPEEPEKSQITAGGGCAHARPVADSLEAVLSVFGEAHGLTVSRDLVNEVLCRFPDRDGVEAAQDVVVWAMEGELRVTAAHRLLRAAMRKQRPSRRRRARDARFVADPNHEDEGLVERMWAYAEAKVARRVAEAACS